MLDHCTARAIQKAFNFATHLQPLNYNSILEMQEIPRITGKKDYKLYALQVSKYIYLAFVYYDKSNNVTNAIVNAIVS